MKSCNCKIFCYKYIQVMLCLHFSLSLYVFKVINYWNSHSFKKRGKRRIYCIVADCHVRKNDSVRKRPQWNSFRTQRPITNPFLASNIKEEKTKLKSGDEPSLFPKGSRKKKGGGVKVRPLRKKNFFLLFFCILLLSSNGHLAWGGGLLFLMARPLRK